jgi:hypothetical protein
MASIVSALVIPSVAVWMKTGQLAFIVGKLRDEKVVVLAQGCLSSDDPAAILFDRLRTGREPLRGLLDGVCALLRVLAYRDVDRHG